jgi:hypothetical protein
MLLMGHSKTSYFISKSSLKFHIFVGAISFFFTFHPFCMSLLSWNKLCWELQTYWNDYGVRLNDRHWRKIPRSLKADSLAWKLRCLILRSNLIVIILKTNTCLRKVWMYIRSHCYCEFVCVGKIYEFAK